MAGDPSHSDLAEALRARLVETGVIGADPRAVALRAATGQDPDAVGPVSVLGRTIGAASYRVTDAQVAEVRALAGSDRAAFEIVLAAGVGAGLQRWDAAMRVIREATDATS